jgi:hypothetical protein
MQPADIGQGHLGKAKDRAAIDKFLGVRILAEKGGQRALLCSAKEMVLAEDVNAEGGSTTGRRDGGLDDDGGIEVLLRNAAV